MFTCVTCCTRRFEAVAHYLLRIPFAVLLLYRPTDEHLSERLIDTLLRLSCALDSDNAMVTTKLVDERIEPESLPYLRPQCKFTRISFHTKVPRLLQPLRPFARSPQAASFEDTAHLLTGIFAPASNDHEHQSIVQGRYGSMIDLCESALQIFLLSRSAVHDEFATEARID